MQKEGAGDVALKETFLWGMHQRICMKLKSQ